MGLCVEIFFLILMREGVGLFLLSSPINKRTRLSTEKYFECNRGRSNIMYRRKDRQAILLCSVLMLVVVLARTG